jgi:hypothetical protein
MHRPMMFLTFGLLAAAWPVGSRAATEEAFTCRHGQVERRVELQSTDATSHVPCQVVYWRDARQSANGQTLWTADHDFGFCIERTRDLVQRLEEGGWSCAKIAPPTSAAQSTPAPAPAPVLVPTPAPPTSTAQSTSARAPASVPAPRETAPPLAAADRTNLDEALARDLKRLDELSASPGARFEVQSTALGDLDRDGINDAAVLMIYRTEAAEGAQFLVAYRFDGNTFRPAARTYLGAPSGDAHASDIERIAEGRVVVLFRVRQPGDPECCPSGSQRESYVLKDGNLIGLASGAAS